MNFDQEPLLSDQIKEYEKNKALQNLSEIWDQLEQEDAIEEGKVEEKS